MQYQKIGYDQYLRPNEGGYQPKAMIGNGRTTLLILQINFLNFKNTFKPFKYNSKHAFNILVGAL
jgi:hypothetical protein